MKKLELSETDSKIGQMAKQYNQNYNNNKKLVRKYYFFANLYRCYL